MNAAPVAELHRGAGEVGLSRLLWFLKDVLVLTRRSLIHVVRNPAQLADVTIQPIMFVVLFTFVFGSAIKLPGGGSYREYVVAGIFAITMAGAAPGVAVGLATDIQSGIIDRFRALPMSRAAVLAGRLTADLLTAVLGLAVVVVVGVAVGWRVHTNPAEVLLGFALALLFNYAMSWAGAAAGMWLHNPESAQAMAFVVFFPMIFVSNAFVALQNMPVWLRVIAEWNPISTVTASCRELFGNPNPSASVQVWPLQHPELATAFWSVALLLIFVPVSIRLYRREDLT
ncbi:MAG TPA: ABC transporter permease [Candidatus Dormibacteraeota bacterium]|nr:ABC transporter permease [Candidatus Dormibacteraeota bacterium]